MKNFIRPKGYKLQFLTCKGLRTHEMLLVTLLKGGKNLFIVTFFYESSSTAYLSMMYAANQNFRHLILFIDEAQFTRNGALNFHSARQWSGENLHAITRSSY